jgi:hypothetical protein
MGLGGRLGACSVLCLVVEGLWGKVLAVPVLRALASLPPCARSRLFVVVRADGAVLSQRQVLYWLPMAPHGRVVMLTSIWGVLLLAQAPGEDEDRADVSFGGGTG